MQSNRITKKKTINKSKLAHHTSYFKCNQCGKEFNKYRKEISWRKHAFMMCSSRRSGSSEALINQVDNSISSNTLSREPSFDMDLAEPFVDSMDVDSVDVDMDVVLQDEDGTETALHDSDIESSQGDVYQQTLEATEEQVSPPFFVDIDDSSMSKEFKKQMKFLTFAKSHGVSRNTVDNLSKIVNEMLSDRGDRELLLSHYKIRHQLFESMPFEPTTYRACFDGCQSFADGAEKPCLNKNPEPMPGRETSLQPQEFKYLPLIQQLAAMLSETETLKLLRYPYSRNTDEDVMSDIFDGEICRKMKTGKPKPNKLTIYLGLYSDGFQVLNNQKHGLTLVHLVILNLPPLIRTEKKYMLQLFLAPGPKSPKDLFSYMEPVLEELKILENEGIKVANSDTVVNAHLLFVGGDIPATTKMAGLKGHTSAHGCKHCTMLQTNWSFRNSGGSQLRSVESYKATDDAIGQKHPTPFASLKRFHGTFFFPVDLMHLLGANIGPQIRNIMMSKDFNHKFSNKSNPLELNGTAVREMDRLLYNSSYLVPTIFSGKIIDISTVSQKRSVDWIHFLRFVVPTVLAEYFDEDTKMALINLARVSNMLCQRSIRRSDIPALKSCILSWSGWLNKVIEEERLSPNTYTVNHHFLLHLPLLIQYMGPMFAYAAFPIETTIGVFKSRVKGKSKIGQNASNVLVEIAAENRLERLFPAEDGKEKKALTEDNSIDGLEMWGPFSTIKLDEARHHLGINNAKALIQNFYARYYGKDRSVEVNGADDFEIGYNMRMPEGVVFGSSLGHVPGNRVHFFAKLNLRLDVIKRGKRVSMKNLTYFGEVITYFRYTPVGGSSVLLAFVKVFEVKNGAIFPFRLPSAPTKTVVVSVHELVALCGRYLSVDNKEHIFWKDYQLHEDPFGSITLL